MHCAKQSTGRRIEKVVLDSPSHIFLHLKHLAIRLLIAQFHGDSLGIYLHYRASVDHSGASIRLFAILIAIQYDHIADAEIGSIGRLCFGKAQRKRLHCRIIQSESTDSQ